MATFAPPPPLRSTPRPNSSSFCFMRMHEGCCFAVVCKPARPRERPSGADQRRATEFESNVDGPAQRHPRRPGCRRPQGRITPRTQSCGPIGPRTKAFASDRGRAPGRAKIGEFPGCLRASKPTLPGRAPPYPSSRLITFRPRTVPESASGRAETHFMRAVASSRRLPSNACLDGTVMLLDRSPTISVRSAQCQLGRSLISS